MDLFIQITINGLMAGLVYILMALGFTLIFGIMRIVNFAHGELYMIAAYGVYLLYGQLGWNYFAALSLSALFVGALGVVLERSLFRPFIGNELNGMIMALAISIILQALALIIFGPEEFGMPRPVSGTISLGAALLPLDRLLVGGCAIFILAIFYVFLHYTKLGLGMRAVAQDEEIAAVQGVWPGYIHAVSFGIGSVLAALAGGLMSPIYTVYPYMGELPMLKAFVVVILGGLGSIPGAVVGGLLLGIIESASATLLNTTIATMISFAFVVAIIAVRPQGMFGKAA